MRALLTGLSALTLLAIATPAAAQSMAGGDWAFGVGAGGRDGAERAMQILTLELERALGQLGTAAFADVGPDALSRPRAGF